jgi:hypothetical protein
MVPQGPGYIHLYGFLILAHVAITVETGLDRAPPVADGQAFVPVEVPESTKYRLKKKLLGPPLHTEELAHERLGKPTALAVFASAIPALQRWVVPISLAFIAIIAFGNLRGVKESGVRSEG